MTESVAREIAAVASAWLATLSRDQRAIAHWPAPGADPQTEAERLRWYYTPTDHGGLTLGAQSLSQQRLVMRLLAAALSPAGYATLITVIGLENELDRVEGFAIDWGQERGRDPGRYHLRVFGDPTGPTPWSWRFGGHHISVNVLVADGAVRSATPLFLGADPAATGLVGGGSLRPLGGIEDTARALVRSFDRDLASRAVVHDRAPSDIIGGNRSHLADGDQMLPLGEVWRGHFSDPELRARVQGMVDTAARESGYGPRDHKALALRRTPLGVAGKELDRNQRALLGQLVAGFQGRVRDGLTVPVDLDTVHFAWAGPTHRGAPHYFRLQSPRILAEWDNTARKANHAHSVWREPGADFGVGLKRTARTLGEIHNDPKLSWGS
ncbi:DUF3500 domain-containing protein [Saccharopolyspora spinosa]|uniref:Uncharacterized protein DUF3500 n=1 Tax=Saccharopolyspora spinosa TaxID=60894 RepID=A0A2N3Y1F5_SACSN|nr:DUF3500 domain-containing protein [Saccharopolyspora spinosa]PKW16768.1 uncharacterized protein DUF3500 [Saccharopolyspora spinosa]